jgi:hypothetical protein
VRERIGRILATALIFLGVFVAVMAMGRAAARPAAQEATSQVSVGATDIGGVVTSSNGPEAGVWVIAETAELPTKFRKIVVTDDRGRYLIPDLPKAHYKVWVRGYGLIDSPAVGAERGSTLALKAVVAPDARAAAQYYPANYWYSLMEVPPRTAFPIKTSGSTQSQAGSPRYTPGETKTQADWIEGLHSGCEMCHQIGDKATRELSANLGTYHKDTDAWARRVMSGQFGPSMNAELNGTFGRDRGLTMFADWSERIARGEVPQAPPRPQGIERNVVLTMWNVGTPKAFLHGILASNKRNPMQNGYGHVYNTDWEAATMIIVDPSENTVSTVKIPLRHEEERATMPHLEPYVNGAPSPYWGDEIVWPEDAVNPKNPQMDSKGRVWIGMQNHKENPTFCKSPNNPYAKNWVPPYEAGWGVDIYDPKTSKFEAVDLCFGFHHLMIGDDKDETVYFSLKIGQIGGVGWVNSRVWDATHDSEKAQGWCPSIIDYNGDGKIGAYTRAPQPPDPKLDRFVDGTRGYGIGVNPVDESVWVAITKPMPGKLLRFVPGPHPPATCMTEIYEPPFTSAEGPSGGGKLGYVPRGVDFDTNGLVWTGLGGSGQLASFDRSKCKVLNGPTATGQHCPEGWTLYPAPGPTFKGESEAKADWLYFNWVDRFNALGLGKNAVVVTGSGSDSLLVFQPATKTWTVMRVPYPIGFYARGVDGRIDDANAGWKGRGIWADNDTRTTWHVEGGKGTPSELVHFQLRPDPLAK